MPALIQIDQVGSGVGVPGVARNDLWKHQPITLTDVGGNTAWRWSLVSKPTGSLSELTSVDTASTSFTPDISGEYRVQLIINTSGVTSHVTLRIRNDNVGEPERRGWRLPGLAEIWNLDEFPITVVFPPSGNIAATTVTEAIQELDTEKGGLALNNTWTGNNTWNAPTSSTFNGDVNFNGGYDFNCAATAFFATATFSGPVVIQNTLSVDQLATFNLGANFLDQTNFQDLVTLNGTATFNGTTGGFSAVFTNPISVTSVTSSLGGTFSGPVNFTSSISVDATVTLPGGDDFRCSHLAIFDGGVEVDATGGGDFSYDGGAVGTFTVLGDNGASFSSIEVVSNLSMQPGGTAYLDGEVTIAGSFLAVTCPSTQSAPATNQETLPDSAGVSLAVDVFESRVGVLANNRTYLLPLPQTLGQRRRFVRPRTSDAFSATLQTSGGLVMGVIPSMAHGWIEVVANGLGLENWVVSAWGGGVTSISPLV